MYRKSENNTRKYFLKSISFHVNSIFNTQSTMNSLTQLEARLSRAPTIDVYL